MRPLDSEESQVLAGASPALQPIVLALRERVLSIHPAATIVAWPKQGIISFGLGPRKMTEHYAFIAVHARHVNLGVYHGAGLTSPGVVLEGSGKGLRHVKVRTVAEAEAPDLRALILVAVEERTAALGMATAKSPA